MRNKKTKIRSREGSRQAGRIVGLMSKSKRKVMRKRYGRGWVSAFKRGFSRSLYKT